MAELMLVLPGTSAVVAPGNPWCPFASGHITPIWFFLYTVFFSLSLSLSSFKDTSHVGFRAHANTI